MKIMHLPYYLILITIAGSSIFQTSCNRNVFLADSDKKLFLADPDKKPVFPGGERALNDYLQDVEYPEKAKVKFIEGEVFVRCYIDEKGRPVDFEITKGTGTILDSAALQHVKNMPEWSPASNNGEPVKAKRTVSISFKLRKSDFDLSIEYSDNNDSNEEGVYERVEEMPEFPGGKEALMEYIKEANYPDLAKNHGIEGSVIVRFVIDEEGNATNVSIVKGTKTILDVAAFLHVKNMPKWKPGYNDGELVKVQYVAPISFLLK